MFLVVGGELSGAYGSLSRVDLSASLINGGIKLHLVKCKKHLSFTHVIAFVNMNFGDETGHLRTDSNIGFTLDGGRESVVDASVG